MARSKRKALSTAAPASSSNALAPADQSDPRVHYIRETPGKSRAQILAKVFMDGDSQNAITALSYGNPSFGGELAITESIDALRAQVARVKEGDLSQVEAMLFGQATTLASIFHECARRSALNMGEYPEAMERYMRLALKAQSQCRTTLEALVETKHPKSVAFVRQANIANGHQQVNNGEAPAGRAEIFENEPNELQPKQARSLDARATAQSIGTDSRSATVVEIDRTTHARRKG